MELIRYKNRRSGESGNVASCLIVSRQDRLRRNYATRSPRLIAYLGSILAVFPGPLIARRPVIGSWITILFGDRVIGGESFRVLIVAKDPPGNETNTAPFERVPPSAESFLPRYRRARFAPRHTAPQRAMAINFVTDSFSWNSQYFIDFRRKR